MVKIAINNQFDFYSEYYKKAVEHFGGEAAELPDKLTKDNLQKLMVGVSGIIITGGDDVNPKLYGEENEYAQKVNDLRDSSEFALIKYADENDIPLLAICRGIQVVNVYFGGSLYQDLTTFGFNEHNKPLEKNGYSHLVETVVGSKLNAICENKFMVNTIHHQGVKKLGEGLKISAYSEDRLIEGVENPHKAFFIGVEWHPERLVGTSENADKLFKAFMAAAEQKAQQKV